MSRQQQQQQYSGTSPAHLYTQQESDFGRKEDDEGCCSCCIAPCKLIGLIFFLPCCIYSCCQAKSNFQKEAKEFSSKSGDTTISQEPRMKLVRPPSVQNAASEMVSKLQAKYKVEPAPDKVKVIDEAAEASTHNEGNGIENKEYLELESLPSSKM